MQIWADRSLEGNGKGEKMMLGRINSRSDLPVREWSAIRTVTQKRA